MPASPATTSRRPPRRTQEERRLGTIDKLLRAATEALIEQGYAGATVQEICARAGVSQGGMFRHFPTREAVLVAAAEDVGRRLLTRYRRELEAQPAKGHERLAAAIRLVRDQCRSRLNRAWFELAVAARTNPGLRKALRPIGERYYADIERLARQLHPELASALGPRFPVLVDTVIAVFDGEVMHHAVVRKPAVEEARLELLASFARLLASS
jgi:AcrR family transcriptional regulator